MSYRTFQLYSPIKTNCSIENDSRFEKENGENSQDLWEKIEESIRQMGENNKLKKMYGDFKRVEENSKEK